MANKVDIKVGYSIDKNGLNELKKQLIDLRMEAEKAKIGGNLTKGLEEASKAASKLGDILDKSWNSKLNQLDLSKVNNGIKTTYGSVEKLKQALSNSGAAGATAYNNFAMSVLNTNTQLKKTSETLDKMAVTFKNTIRYGISSAVFNNLSNSIQRAYSYAKELDTSLNDIRIVTGKSADEMDRFAVRANRVAKELGRSTKDFTNAALIYYQQGLGNEEAQARAEVTMKAANVTGQSGREVSEQLTAVWNGYKVTAEEAELYVDKLAAVAAGTAADLEELSTGMSKVASAANLMGVDIDQLNAQLATIVSVTRQAPESVGTALKTIYARMGDIKAGLDDEVTLGKYTEKMAQMGVNVLNANGQLRDMGEVIEEIGGKWTTMSREQQIALSQIMAGTRQYNNLLSLFDNWDMYTKSLEMSANAAGTLQKQQDIYMESTEAHLQKLSTEAERTYDILFDTNAVNSFSDALTGVLNIFNNLLAGLGGGINDFVFFGSTIANIFNKQIGQSIERQIENIEIMKANISKEDIQRQIIAAHSARGEDVTNASALDKEAALMERTLELQKYLTQEQLEQLSNSTSEIGVLEQRIQNAEQYGKIANKYMSDYMNAEDATIDDFKEELKIQNELLDIEKNKYNTLKDNLLNYNERDKFYKLEEEQQKNITDSIRNSTISLKDQEAVARIIAAIENEQELDENDIKIVLKEQRDIRNQQKQAVDELQFGLQGIQDKENGVLEGLKEQLSVEEKTVKAIHDQGDRQKMLSELTQGLSAVISLGTSAIGIIKTIGDESLSSEEKIERVLSVALTNLPILLTNLSSLGKLLPNISAATKTLAMTMGVEGITAASGFGAALGGIIATIAPYVLAIGAIVGVTYALVKAYNADADAARDAAKMAKDLEDTYKSLSNTALELTNNISEYDKAKEDLEKLNEGTEEYAETLEKANEKAKELIETLKLYNQYTIKSGLIEIDSNALREAQLEAQIKAKSANQLMYEAKIHSNRMNLKSETTNLARSVGSAENMRGDYFTMWSSDINEVVAKLKTVGDVEYDRLMNDQKAFNDWIDTVFKGNNKMMVLSERISKQSDAFDKLIKKTEEATIADEYYTKQIMGTLIDTKYGSQAEVLATKTRLNGETYIDEARASQIKTILKSYSNNNVIDLQKKLENIEARNNLWNRDLRNYEYAGKKLTVSDDEDLARTYARIVLGREDYADLQYKGGWDKGTLKTANGTETIIQDMSDKAMRQQIVLKLETDNVTKEIEEALNKDNIINGIESIINSATAFGQEYGTDFSDALIAALASTDNKIDLSQSFKRLDPDEVMTMQGLNAEQLRQKLGLTDEVVQAIGEETTTKLLNSFSESLATYNWNIDTAIAASMEKISGDLEAAGEGLSKKKLAEYSKDVQVYAKNLMELADSSEEVSEEMKYDSDTAVEFAFRIVRMNKAIENLAKNFDNWKDILQNSSEISQEYAEAMYEIEEILSDIYGIETKYISQDFVKEHLDEIGQAAEGSEVAIEALRAQLGEELITKITVDNKIENADEILINFQNLRDQIESITSGMQIGDSIDDSKLVTALNKIIEDSHMTVEQANQMFSALKLEPTYKTEKVIQKQRIPRTKTTHKVTNVGIDMSSGFPLPTWTTEDITEELSPLETDMEIPVTAIRADGQQPHIDGIKVAPNSSFNNYSSKNKGGGSPSGSSGKSSGGGSSKAKEPDHKDPIEEELNRYHDVDIQLTQISTDLKRLEDQKKKLFGKDLIDNLNKQLALLNKQIETTRQKIEIANGEAKELQAKLSEKGVLFNEDGTIANYADVYVAQMAYVNAIIDKYNNMSVEAQETAKDTVKDAEDEFKEFLKYIDRYDALVSKELPGLQDDIQAAIDEQITIQIEEFDMEIEIRLDLAEAERDWNKFKKDIIDEIKDDDILGQAVGKLTDFSSYYKEDSTGIIQSLTRQVKNTLNELDEMDKIGSSNFYGNNRTAALEDLQKYYTTLMENLTDVEELQKEIHEAYIDMQDEAQDKFDEQIETYEMIGDLIDHDMKIIQMVYGEDSYSILAQYYDKQQENNNKQLDFQKQQVQFWRQQIDTLEEGTKEWENAKEKWMDAVKDWNNLVENSIENLQDRYLNAINDIFYRLNDKVTNGLGLDYVNEQWNLINKNADQYLDSINTLYEIQALENKYLDAIDKTDNIGAQRQLKEIMDAELADLRERDKLTQYDVERANKKYEIALKQIALQEAQQNKTKMRLRRDSQGNYRYEYVSDNDQINQIQDELNNLYNSLYNFDKNRYQENLSQIYDVWTEFQEKMAEAAQINDPQKRAEKELLLREQYGELINGLAKQNSQIRLNVQDSAFRDLSRLYDKDVKEYQNMTKTEIDTLMNGLVPQWQSGVQIMADAFAGHDGFLSVCEEAFQELDEATEDYESSLDDLQYAAGQDFNDIANGIDDTIDRTEDLLYQNDDLIGSYEDEMDAIENVIDQLDDLVDKYKEAKREAIAATQAAYEYWAAENRKAASEARENVESKENKPASTSQPSDTNTKISSVTDTGDGNLTLGEVVTFSGKYYYDSYGTSPVGSRYSGIKDGVVVDRITNNPYGIHIHSADGRFMDLGWVKKSQLSGYDTGGYTGEWGHDGRLALLHQKELVLNAHDTENMLNAVTIMRDITSTLGGSVLNRLAGIAAANTNGTVSGGLLDQNVNIQATFPNVTSSHEIENALNNLVNMAAIRANKKGN